MASLTNLRRRLERLAVRDAFGITPEMIELGAASFDDEFGKLVERTRNTIATQGRETAINAALHCSDMTAIATLIALSADRAGEMLVSMRFIDDTDCGESARVWRACVDTALLAVAQKH
jgi:hypothetical protein